MPLFESNWVCCSFSITCRDADRAGVGVLRVLEGHGDQRHVGPQLHLAHRRQAVQRVLRELTQHTWGAIQLNCKSGTSSQNFEHDLGSGSGTDSGMQKCLLTCTPGFLYLCSLLMSVLILTLLRFCIYRAVGILWEFRPCLLFLASRTSFSPNAVWHIRIWDRERGEMAELREIEIEMERWDNLHSLPRPTPCFFIRLADASQKAMQTETVRYVLRF